MDLDRPLALFTVGGIVTFGLGAILARTLGWPAGNGDPLQWLPLLGIAVLLVVLVGGAVAWGNGTANADERTSYW
jgi:hypothetical protein